MAHLEITLQIDPEDRAAAAAAGDLFTGAVAGELGPLLKNDPDIRVFDVARA